MASEFDDWTSHVALETRLEDRHAPRYHSKFPHEACILPYRPWSNRDNPSTRVCVLGGGVGAAAATGFWLRSRF